MNLALGLRERGRAVGVFDADLHGPNLPLMIGITRDKWSQNWTLAVRGGMRIRPVEKHGLKVVSAGFIVAEDQPLKIPGSTVQFMTLQLLRQTEWGELDYLIIDLPPGTGDVQQILLQQTAIDGAIIVVTPQYVAHLDGRKAARMYRLASIPILGGIENMASMRCPHCGNQIKFFPEVPFDRSLWNMGVERLGSLPLDPALSLASDRGHPLLSADGGGGLTAAIFREISSRLEGLLESL